jgi:hypothetical protein
MTKCKVTERALPEAKHDRDFIIGVSIGLGQHFTAIAILERFEELTGEAKNLKWLTKVRYEAPHLERLPLDAGYTEITERLKALIADLPPHGRLRTLVDWTICDRPPIDHMRKENLKVIPVRIVQSGDTSGGSLFGFSVRKHLLFSSLRLLFNDGRLDISEELPETAELMKELQNFSLRPPSGTTTDLEAWRENPGDDLVFAMMMPCWYGEKKLGTIFHLPPMPRAPVETRQPTLDELLKLQPNTDPDGMERL